MRQSLVLVLVLAALVLMPKEHATQAQPDATPSPAATVSATSTPSPTPSPTAKPIPPVIYLGDSVTQGAFASTPRNMYVWRVYYELKRRGIDPTNDVKWSFDPYSDLINARAIAGQHRQWVFVEVGVHWASFTEAEFREVYGAMLDCLAGGSVRVVVGTIPWLNWPADQPLYQKMATFSQIVREEAAKRGVAVADLWAYTNRNPDAVSRPGQLCFMSATCHGDDYHPGDVGHALIAAAYGAAIDVALSQALPHAIGGCNIDPYLDALASGKPIPFSSGP
jgi:lysophospholipase L1-like esterase